MKFMKQPIAVFPVRIEKRYIRQIQEGRTFHQRMDTRPLDGSDLPGSIVTVLATVYPLPFVRPFYNSLTPWGEEVMLCSDEFQKEEYKR